MIQRILAVLWARNKEFLRDRGALAWNFLFPVLVVLGFAFAFSKNGQDLFKVAVQRPSGEISISSQNFLGTKYIEVIQVAEGEAALDEQLSKLRRHQTDMVLSLGPPKGAGDRYWINSSSPKGYLLERLLGSGSLRQSVEGKEIRYVDWLIAGLLSMNMMFSSLFGVGYTIVRYRKNGVLKRLKATPLSAFEFLLAQVISRMYLLIFVTTVVFAGTHAVIHFQMLGSYLSLALVMILGALCLVSLGLVVAARISSEEFAGGLLNLISWPMMFLSGVWFSLEGAQPWVRSMAQLMPLTHVIDAARKIMTEGAGLAAVSGDLFALVGMTIAFMIIASVTFRWE